MDICEVSIPCWRNDQSPFFPHKTWMFMESNKDNHKEIKLCYWLIYFSWNTRKRIFFFFKSHSKQHNWQQEKLWISTDQMKEISEQGEAVMIHCHKIKKAATSRPAEQVSALKEKSQSRMSSAGRMLLCGKKHWRWRLWFEKWFRTFRLNVSFLLHFLFHEDT